MKNYRKKPVVIQAVRLTSKTRSKILDWGGPNVTAVWQYDGPRIAVKTLEGTLTADHGDWIIKGVKGEFYPCKPDIFKATYEEVDDE